MRSLVRPAACSTALGRDPDSSAHRPELTYDTAGGTARGVPQQLPLDAAFERDRRLVGRRRGGVDETPEGDRSEVDLLLARLFPGGPELSVHLERRHRGECVALRPRRLLYDPREHPEETDLDAHGRRARRLEHALGLHRPGLGSRRFAEGPWRQHAELPANLVLLRRRPVRVEDVTLVDDRIGNLAGRREAPFTRRGHGGRRHLASSPAAFNNDSKACSHVGSACAIL